jgi:SAM-dependent methyltransferase
LTFDYFSVGDRLALQSKRPQYPPSPMIPLVWEFEILQPGHIPVGQATVAPGVNLLNIRIHWLSDVHADEAVDAVRLITALCRKVTPAELLVDCGTVEGPVQTRLLAEGLEPCGPIWRHAFARISRPLVKSNTVAECSADPFQVPWNFEPRQWEILGPFLMHARGSQLPVLEIGCGFGKNTVLLDESNLETYGIDISHDAVRHCRHWVRHPNRILTASIANLPFGDNSFENVLDVGCLHCCPPELLNNAIDEAARVLKPGGHLFSRFFKPRDPAWIDAQPYRVRRVGLTTQAYSELLERRFRVSLCEERDMTSVMAVLTSK